LLADVQAIVALFVIERAWPKQKILVARLEGIRVETVEFGLSRRGMSSQGCVASRRGEAGTLDRLFDWRENERAVPERIGDEGRCTSF
jgi:hypothetical protein